MDASSATIKAAWRRLARQNHPDLTAGDPVASRAATRRMAEINAAYQELRDDGRSPGRASTRSTAGRPYRTSSREDAHDTQGSPGWSGPGAPGPTRPRRTRPVTARVDTSDTFQPRNQTTTKHAQRTPPHPLGRPPFRAWVEEREPPRASDPTGPLRRSRVRRYRRPEPPPLEDALALRIAFGKFRGHTLGEIAAFEPSYIDWVAGTITKDPDLVAAARVIRADLDTRGIVRSRRAGRIGRQPVD